jgi:hypothetical protein
MQLVHPKEISVVLWALLLARPLPHANAQNGIPAPGARGTVLATLSTAEGHTFVFGRSVRGNIVVGESAPIGTKPILDPTAVQAPASQLYTELAKGAEAPPILKSAEEAAPTAAASLIAPSTVPPKAADPLSTVSVSPIPIIYSLTPNQQWFQSTFCSSRYISFCDLQHGSANTSLYQWTFAPNYYAFGLNDSANQKPANMYEWVWNGSSWQFDWASPAIRPGTYWYEWWWNTNPVYRATDLVVPDTSPTGLSGGGITPENLQVSYDTAQEFNFNVGGPPFSTQFPNDAEVTCYVSGIRITTFSTSLSGLNAGIGAVCPQQQWYNPNPQGAVCQGKTTGQTATTSVVAPYFAPANCCRSMGGTGPC